MSHDPPSLHSFSPVTGWRGASNLLAPYSTLLVLLACAGILAARRPTELRLPQFWAEDGLVFFTEAHTLGPKAFFWQYGGYLHLVPRCIAAVSRCFDPAHAPTVFVYASFVLTLYVSARTLSARFPFPLRPTFALAAVLVPDAFEVLLFVTNLQWVLAGGLLALLVSSDARRWWQYLHDVSAALLLGLTGPFSVLFAPLFIWRAAARRTMPSLVLAALIALCAAAQMWSLYHHPVYQAGPPPAVAKILAAPGMRIGGSLLIGAYVPPDLPLFAEIGLGLAVLGMVAFLAGRRGALRPERAWLGVAFALLLFASLYRCRFTLPELCHAGFGSRYFFPLQLLVLWLLLTAVRVPPRWLGRGAAAMVIWSTAINLPRLREAGLTDLHWADYTAKLRAGEAVAIPVNPGGDAWMVRLGAKK